ncbi:DUF1592 domain-containing protein [Telmatocola sphagniphila]|uniref:DUF1592 domain-containing protein n=1 Tax=Telmatocola sphagniphila TaxID=1123043 RepID=A0A8E6B984_9BACT|nr:DUF1592 domain-containing protein [Telmatocola sphagniphila]QVL33734.1 DUF1592 domain-containing protein [Telmatocola sphagniphila]
MRSYPLALLIILLISGDFASAAERLFVAVGYGGRRLISRDGIHWEIAAEWKENGGDDAHNLTSVVFAKGKFVAVGGAFGGHILVSPDGRTWREVESPKFRVNPVLFGNDRFVAGGPDQTLLWSSDGEKWQKGGKIEAKEATHFRVGAFGNNTFVFMGNAGGNSPTTWIATSKNGEKIEKVRVDLPQLFNVVYGKDCFVAVGAEGRRLRSTDGLKWEHEVLEKGIELRSLVWSGREFIAGGSGQTYRSADGITWSKEAKGMPCHLLYADDKVYIGTNWPGQMLSSPDGQVWSKHEKLTPNGINQLAVGELAPANTEEKSQPVQVFADAKALIATRCSKCHNDKIRKGGIDLSILADEKSLAKHRKIWRQVVTQVETSEMPPEDQPRLGEVQKKSLVQFVRARLSEIEAAEKQKPDPGPALIRRLTRTEYNRAVRDLFGLEDNIAEAVGMPEDTQGENFDNLSAALNFSDAQIEKYFSAADYILEKLYTPPTQGKKPKVPVSRELDRWIVSWPDNGISLQEATREILAPLLRRAYRRPVERRELERFVELVRKAAPGAKSFEESLKPALKALLVSPNFLIRIERDRGKTAEENYRVRDQELAVRLAFFLWGAPPDQKLNELADRGELSQPAVYAAQVKRLLADPKAKALTEDFAAQWLRLRKLPEARPSTEFFPTFNANLRQAMGEEVTQFFDHLRSEDGSILDLIDARYTYVNAELARHYGLPDTRKEFHRVEWSDANRGGLLGMSAILAMTSHTNRTSPTLRGKYVLDVILGTPPPPPPPDVGVIDEAKSKGKGAQTFRELLTQHATQPSCAGCHSKIDPLGFGLEVFDPIGRLRNPGSSIDASGKLPTGEHFVGAAELKKILLQRKDQFTRNFVEKMLTFALGRELRPPDESTVNRIVEKVVQRGYRFSAVVEEIANSYPFLYRRNSTAD